MLAQCFDSSAFYIKRGSVSIGFAEICTDRHRSWLMSTILAGLEEQDILQVDAPKSSMCLSVQREGDQLSSMVAADVPGTGCRSLECQSLSEKPGLVNRSSDNIINELM